MKNERKVTDFTLFFEWPKCSCFFWEKFLEELKKEGISGTCPEILDSVPGFFYTQGCGTKFTEYSGIGIILTDANGLISGLQVRCDDDTSASRYKLFSSSFADLSNEENENIRGASLGQAADFSFPEGSPLGFVITEGKFKALALAKRGFAALSLNGVTSQEPADALFKLAAGKTDVIYIAFDMDVIANEGVKKEALRLCRKVEMNGFRPIFMTWPVQCGKGIDDFLNNCKDEGLLKYITPEKLLIY